MKINQLGSTQRKRHLNEKLKIKNPLNKQNKIKPNNRPTFKNYKNQNPKKQKTKMHKTTKTSK